MLVLLPDCKINWFLQTELFVAQSVLFWTAVGNDCGHFVGNENNRELLLQRIRIT